ncbi:hypothetical protein KDA_28380 [Dictyobacter alpinus]|uniref:Uncharacterized protein n=1 Tax=Dictyobacter alpinus TaxID=2014873 RepID=A0A402B7M3_9CHLR|nr:hypothetical protein KDA_28380 [Dictyobacter alpinus]
MFATLIVERAANRTRALKGQRFFYVWCQKVFSEHFLTPYVKEALERQRREKNDNGAWISWDSDTSKNVSDSRDGRLFSRCVSAT